jgi:hypothetical protein
MNKLGISLSVCLLATYTGEGLAQSPTLQNVESVAGFYRNPTSSVVTLVGSQGDSGSLQEQPSSYPPFVLKIAPIGSLAYDPAEDQLPLVIQQVEGTQNFSSYGEWVSMPRGEPIVHGVFAAGSRQGYTPPSNPGLQFYYGSTRWFYVDTPYTSAESPLGGEGEGDVCIAVKWNTASASILENFRLANVAGPTNSVYTINDGIGTVTHLPLLALNSLTAPSGTAQFEFYAPGAAEVVGTFSGIAKVSGTTKSRVYAGAFGALLISQPCQ